MSKRNDRREAERLARKAAYLESRQKTPQTAAVHQPQAMSLTAAAPSPSIQTASPKPVISDAQLAANRANAQFSCGPKSPEGKAKSSLNALKHGLTSQTVVLPGEDPAEYARQFDLYLEIHRPVGEDELRLVQSLLDCQWRLNRILRTEGGLFLKGHAEFESKFTDRAAHEREALIQAEIFLKYEKSLRTLHQQEARLRRTKEKEQAELTRLQAQRKREELQAIMAASIAYPTPTSPEPENGFVFEIPETELYDPLKQAA